MVIIGGADGPTSIFITPSSSFINWFGILLVVLIMIPNIIWAVRHKGEKKVSCNPFMTIAEQIGRYGCMFLMMFNIGILEFGCASGAALITYLLGSVLLVLLYWAFWIVLQKKPGFFPKLMLAVLPTLLFLLCGIAQRHYLLAGFAVLFGIGHIAITYRSAKENGQE